MAEDGNVGHNGVDGHFSARMKKPLEREQSGYFDLIIIVVVVVIIIIIIIIMTVSTRCARVVSEPRYLHICDLGSRVLEHDSRTAKPKL